MRIVRAALCLSSLASSVAAARGGRPMEPFEQSGFAVEFLSLDYGAIEPGLANVRFKGSGTLNGVPTQYSVLGRDAGYGQPAMTEFVIRPTVRFKRWFLVGVHGEVLWGTLGVNSSIDAWNAGLGNSIGGYGGGAHTGAVWSDHDYDVRVEVDLGVRQFSVDIQAFDSSICSYKGRTYTCYPGAYATQAYVRPNVHAGLHLGDMVTVGGYGGVDVSRGVGWMAGGWITIHSPE